MWPWHSPHGLINIQSPCRRIVPTVRVNINRPTSRPGLQPKGPILQPQPVHGAAPRAAIYPQNEGNLLGVGMVFPALPRLEQPVENLLVRAVVGRGEVAGPVSRVERAERQEGKGGHEVGVWIGIVAVARGEARRLGRGCFATIVEQMAATGNMVFVRQAAHAVNG